ncbi:MFS transporter [Acidipropionibacterium virtanenii]|uniref:MFS transporter n=1 Tax=Acidipropionibacterium virtanenii TaxID=2057246 RepID=UPI001C68F7FE|nr:MFS transporter [Acidipropionibacterium virtanenii]
MVTVLVASFLLPFAVTGPAIILPALTADLHASASGAQWVQNAYNAVFAATVLAMGSLADRFGRRRVLRVGIAAFALAIALAAAVVIGLGILALAGALLTAWALRTPVTEQTNRSGA